MAKQTIQSMGGKACRAKYGPDFYRKIGRKGGRAFKKKHGSVSEFIKKKGHE